MSANCKQIQLSNTHPTCQVNLKFYLFLLLSPFFKLLQLHWEYCRIADNSNFLKQIELTSKQVWQKKEKSYVGKGSTLKIEKIRKCTKKLYTYSSYVCLMIKMDTASCKFFGRYLLVQKLGGIKITFFAASLMHYQMKCCGSSGASVEINYCS